VAKMLQLSTEQQSRIMQAAAPLQPTDREAFRERVLAELEGEPEVGEGVLHRIIRAVQRDYWLPPLTTGHEVAPRQLKKL
jgi:hypothetical protein